MSPPLPPRRAQPRPSARAVLALAVTPRWLAFALAAVVAAAGCVAMGVWQWHRTQEVLAAERAVLAIPASIESITTAGGELSGSMIGRSVTAAGSWEQRGEQVVVSRLLGDRSGSWVLTGLRLADGTVQPVLRGWIAAGAAPEAATGAVQVHGMLQPPEAFYADASPPSGQLVALNEDLITQRMPGPLRPGIVFLAGQQPASPTAPTPVPVPASAGVVTYPLQNASYALQWLVFACFALGAFGFLLVREAGRAVAEDADYRSVP